MYNLEDYKEEFLTFVKHQNPDRKVDHNSWESCAVGDFSLTLLGHRNLWVRDYGDFEDTVHVPEFDRFVAVLSIMGTQEGTLNTYGELQGILKEIEEDLDYHWDYNEEPYDFLSEFIDRLAE